MKLYEAAAEFGKVLAEENIPSAEIITYRKNDDGTLVKETHFLTCFMSDKSVNHTVEIKPMVF